jgi:hypothetical protein
MILNPKIYEPSAYKLKKSIGRMEIIDENALRVISRVQLND